ncbi:MAG: response regulator [Oligoflexus sp.]
MGHILIVEDDPMLRELIAEILEASFDCRIDLATDAFEAYALATKIHFDLIISDYEMPYVDGLTFVHALREKPATLNCNTHVIILSGHSKPDPRFYQMNAVHFISKPPRLDRFIQLVKGLLDKEEYPCQLG